MKDSDVALIVLDAFAQSVCRRSLEEGCLGGFVRYVGNEVRVVYPAGMEAEVARMFYRAADEMVSRIKPTASTAKH